MKYLHASKELYKLVPANLRAGVAVQRDQSSYKIVLGVKDSAHQKDLTTALLKQRTIKAKDSFALYEFQGQYSVDFLPSGSYAFQST